MSLLHNKKFFSWYAWFFLAFNIYTILGGAFVRATGSGAGCGEHWPLCNGVIIPQFNVLHTVIEFTHRISSGLIGLGVLILCLWSFFLKGFEKRTLSFIRRASCVAVLFVLFEALIGAWLVLFGLVAQNSSAQRACVMALHLVSTFILIASLVYTAAWSSNFKIPQFSGQGKKLFFILLAPLALLLVGMSGAITALGDTLFRPTSLKEGFITSFESGNHFLVNLRIYHPLLAVLVTFYILMLAWNPIVYPTSQNISRTFKKLQLSLTTVCVLQIFCGFLNIILHAPVWMQLIHLFVANLIWIFTLLFVNKVTSE